MADIIALESEAKTIGGSSSTVTTNLCCTKTRAEALNCLINGTYDNNQLVCYKDLNSANCLIIQANEDSEITLLYHLILSNHTDVSPTVYYKKSTESSFKNLSISSKITLSKGETLYLYGDNPNGFNRCTNSAPLFYITGNVSLGGNLQALISNSCPLTVPNRDCFDCLFYNSTGITDASSLNLYATTLARNCYWNMFAYCTSLKTAPKLPATTLAEECYLDMFQLCTSLTAAPELPATTLANYCYSGMFNACSSLVVAPALPATELAEFCYDGMFRYCTSLVTAPELPATTLVRYCYEMMFEYCSKLNYIKALFTTTPSSNTVNYWVEGVASSGTFIKSPNATWNVIGVHGVPSGWTISGETKYTLAWNANGGTLSGGTAAGSYYAGTIITAPTATRTGYTLSGWSPSFTGTMPAANTIYLAQWSLNNTTYSVTASAGTGGTVSWSSKSVGGTGVSITATPNSGYIFSSWSCTGGAKVSNSTSATTTVTATASGTITANFISSSSGITIYTRYATNSDNPKTFDNDDCNTWAIIGSKQWNCGDTGTTYTSTSSISVTLNDNMDSTGFTTNEDYDTTVHLMSYSNGTYTSIDYSDDGVVDQTISSNGTYYIVISDCIPDYVLISYLNSGSISLTT